MNKYFLLIILINSAMICNGQIYENPVAAEQSHADLIIEKIEITPENTIVILSITNQMQSGGWFCADNNIILKESKGNKEYKLVRSENIPICPQKHEFKRKGEILQFLLYFPPIDTGIVFIDLIENCDQACFSFRGIILDNIHNKKVITFEKALDLFTHGAINESIPLFKQILDSKPTIESHIFGLSYFYLVLSYQSLNDKANTDFWYDALKNSDVPLKSDILKELNLKLGY
ncbi:MAG: hypothetical protein AB7S50_03225 [Bacteroidales bacterium]